MTEREYSDPGGVAPEKDRWLRRAFQVDALLSVAAGCVWLFTPAYFVRSTFGVADPGEAHRLLAIKGGLLLLLQGGIFYGWLARSVGLREPAFRAWQGALTPIDLGMLGLGVRMLMEASGGDPRTAAISQIVVASLRIGLRSFYFLAKEQS